MALLAYGSCLPTSHTGMIGTEGKVIDMSYAKYSKKIKEAVVSRIMSGEETISVTLRQRKPNGGEPECGEGTLPNWYKNE